MPILILFVTTSLFLKNNNIQQVKFLEDVMLFVI
jgi:hypothetical protein